MKIKAVEVIYLVVYVGNQTLQHYISEKQTINKLLVKPADAPVC